MTFTKEQLIARIETQKETALQHPECSIAQMDIRLAEITLAAIAAPAPDIDALTAEIVENLVDLGGADEEAEAQYRAWVHKKLFAYAVALTNSKGGK